MNLLRKECKSKRKFLGVCGGISRFLDPEIDPIIIRLSWIFLSVFNPIMILVYFVLALVLNSHEEEFKVDKWKPIESPNDEQTNDNTQPHGVTG